MKESKSQSYLHPKSTTCVGKALLYMETNQKAKAVTT